MNIILSTTMRCDLKCIHCLRDYPKARPDFPMELLPRLLVETRSYGAGHVTMTGGEPCLHPEFDSMIEMIVSAGYTWSFVSHGGHQARYEPLMNQYRGSFWRATMSLDGADAMTHDTIRRRKGSFERVTTAARDFAAAGFHVRLQTTYHRENQGQVEAIIQLAESLGAKSYRAAGLIPAPWNQYLQLSDADYDHIYQRVMASRKDSSLKIMVSSALRTGGGIHFCPVLNLAGLYFNARGEMMFCCDTHSHGAIIGSLYDFPLATLIEKWIAYSAELQQHRARMIAGGHTRPGFDTCAFCNHFFSEVVPIIEHAR